MTSSCTARTHADVHRIGAALAGWILCCLPANAALASGTEPSHAEAQPRSAGQPAPHAAVAPSAPAHSAPSMLRPSPPASPTASPSYAVAPHPAARPAADGSGQVLDMRHYHGRYYPPVGSVTPTLPSDYRPYYRGEGT